MHAEEQALLAKTAEELRRENEKAFPGCTIRFSDLEGK